MEMSSPLLGIGLLGDGCEYSLILHFEAHSLSQWDRYLLSVGRVEFKKEGEMTGWGS
jgi:hypothetical protein